MKLKITVHGVAYEVDVEVLDAEHDFLQASPLPPVAAYASAAPMAAPPAAAAPVRPPAGPGEVAQAGSVISPIAGTVLEIKCKAGDRVKNGQELLVIEAMKMETAISSHRDGTIKRVAVAAGDSVRENEILVEFE